MSTGIPASIYHYTNAHGAKGIFENREVWVTSSSFLNDPREVQFAGSQLLDQLESYTDTNSELAEKLEPVVSSLKRSYTDNVTETQTMEEHTYLLSFSTEGDLLNMWTSYAGQHGYCVEFDSEKILTWANRPFPSAECARDRDPYAALVQNAGLNATLLPVNYGTRAIDELASELRSLVYSLPASQYSKSEMKALFRKILAIKPEGFSYEKEVRLVVQEDLFGLKPRIRISAAGELVPYHSIKIPHSAIRSVRLAPGNKDLRSVNALRALTRDGGRGLWDYLDIEFSVHDYRW